VIVANAGEALTAELALIDALADVAVVDNEEDLRVARSRLESPSSGVVERRELGGRGHSASPRPAAEPGGFGHDGWTARWT
jgi:hypothetical protein